ncbi:alpha/beta hydrolase [Neobacillus mesonae]|nr:alpha/beta hydrolase [Neobacillus mesonae]
MKVTNKMIDKQLRVKGAFMDFFLRMNSTSEDKWHIFLHKSKKMMAKSTGENIEGLMCSEEWIPRKNSEFPLRIRIYKPLQPADHVPGILWIHGGGYALGNPELSKETYKRLIKAKNCVIIAPDYRLSIDAPYPAALEDCYDALLWMKEHASELGIRTDQIMAGGESAGGGLTAALTLYARDKGEVNIAFQMPLYPMIDDRMLNESAKDNNAPIWNSSFNEWAWKLYLGDLYGKEVPPYAAAARAANFTNLPPTVTFVGDIEPFRDETIQYVEQLRKAGVPVHFELYTGCYHGFDTINPSAEVSKRATAFFIDTFKYAADHYYAEQE